MKLSETERVRAWRDSKKKKCPKCKKRTVAYDTIACRSCHAEIKREKALSRTVSELKKESGSLRWTDHVRYFSRKMYSFDKCCVCGYDKHVEVAHKKAICEFPDTATIQEINAEDNVLGLCPNHHWEFDNGILHL